MYTFSPVLGNRVPPSKVPSPEKAKKPASPSTIEIPPLPSDTRSPRPGNASEKTVPNGSETIAVDTLPCTLSPVGTSSSAATKVVSSPNIPKEPQASYLPPPVSSPAPPSPVKSRPSCHATSTASTESGVVALPNAHYSPPSPSPQTVQKSVEKEDCCTPPLTHHSRTLSGGNGGVLQKAGFALGGRSPLPSSPTDTISLPPPAYPFSMTGGGAIGNGMPSGVNGERIGSPVGSTGKFSSPPITGCASSFVNPLPCGAGGMAIGTAGGQTGGPFPKYGSNDLIPGGGFDPVGSSLINRHNIDGYLGSLQQQGILPPTGVMPGTPEAAPLGHPPGSCFSGRGLGMLPTPQYLPMFVGDTGRPVGGPIGVRRGEPLGPVFPMPPGGKAELFLGEPDNDLLPPLGGGGNGDPPGFDFGFGGEPGKGTRGGGPFL